MEQMIEIGEKLDGGLLPITQHGETIGHVVKTASNMWLAIPRRYGRNAKLTAHQLRRDAIDAVIPGHRRPKHG